MKKIKRDRSANFYVCQVAVTTNERPKREKYATTDQAKKISFNILNLTYLSQ